MSRRRNVATNVRKVRGAVRARSERRFRSGAASGQGDGDGRSRCSRACFQAALSTRRSESKSERSSPNGAVLAIFDDFSVFDLIDVLSSQEASQPKNAADRAGVVACSVQSSKFSMGPESSIDFSVTPISEPSVGCVECPRRFPGTSADGQLLLRCRTEHQAAEKSISADMIHRNEYNHAFHFGVAMSRIQSEIDYGVFFRLLCFDLQEQQESFIRLQKITERYIL